MAATCREAAICRSTAMTADSTTRSGVDVKFESGPIYATAAWEIHKRTNRNSDGIGSNHPIYGYLQSINSPLLDFASYDFLVAEYPGVATAGNG